MLLNTTDDSTPHELIKILPLTSFLDSTDVILRSPANLLPLFLPLLLNALSFHTVITMPI